MQKQKVNSRGNYTYSMCSCLGLICLTLTTRARSLPVLKDRDFSTRAIAALDVGTLSLAIKIPPYPSHESIILVSNSCQRAYDSFLLQEKYNSSGSYVGLRLFRSPGCDPGNKKNKNPHPVPTDEKPSVTHTVKKSHEYAYMDQCTKKKENVQVPSVL
ncbi:hypothetical protein F4821DRAFT_237397 [Hypoxylon rubiginosum]|uniref:Uncharacterized protein n=1 Tax=Hypoxylon rubiginosum TaxID=110542 RepID=A0ACC0D272_9PEZI|nr:hypothetical protein F4821DRAFT_237397 [Hypoxylon rubiginosum]